MKRFLMRASAWMTEGENVLLIAITVLAVLIRIQRLSGVDVFEDGYANHLISRNLYSTGIYSDPISGMTGGNWLPLYHFIGAGLMFITGSDSILVLKYFSVALSAGTVIVTGLIGRRLGRWVGIAAASFMALNPLDIVMSSMSLPDDLALFSLTFGSFMIVFKRDRSLSLVLGSIAILVAVMTRYEAWVVVIALAAYVLISDGRPSLRSNALVFLPATIFTVIWMAITFNGTFVAERIIDQTSLQPSIVSERTHLGFGELAVLFWYNYARNYVIVIALALTIFVWRKVESPQLRFFWAAWWLMWILVTVLIATGRIVGSYRYIAFSCFALTIVGAYQLRHLTMMFVERINARRRVPYDKEGMLTYSMSVLIVAILLVPSIDFAYNREDSVSVLNDPQMRAGLWLKDHYTEGIVIIDSPIAAYYSDVPSSELKGSRSLPEDREGALSYIEGKVSYVVFTDHPYFRIVSLFPELRNGTSIGIFKMVHDPNSWEMDFGALPTYIYEVDTESISYPMDKSLSVRFKKGGDMGPIPLLDDSDIDGGGRGFGTPVLQLKNGEFVLGSAEMMLMAGGARAVYSMDRTRNGTGIDNVGTVIVDYAVENGTLTIAVDYGWVPVGSQLIMLNEVDSSVLSRFVDFTGNDTMDLRGWTESTAWYNYLIDGSGHGMMLKYHAGSRVFVGDPLDMGSGNVVGVDHVITVEETGDHRFEYSIYPA